MMGSLMIEYLLGFSLWAFASAWLALQRYYSICEIPGVEVDE